MTRSGRLSDDAVTAPFGALRELPESEVTAVLQTIALRARSLAHADYVALGIGTNPDRPFEHWVFLGVPRATAKRIGRFPRPVGLLGAVARGGEVIRCRDLRRDPRFGGLPAHHPEVASFLGVPIRQSGRPVGNLYLANAPLGREFSDSDERIISALAASAGIAIDTAALYVAEKRERAWLRTVIDQMPHAIFLYDDRCHLQTMNQACAPFCRDSSRTDEYGNPLLDLRNPDGGALAREDLPMVRAFEGGEVILDRELVLRHPDGRSVPVVLSALPVRDTSGKLTGVTVIIEDISERKRLERMREEWSAIIAHDLRQPVGTIALAADLLVRHNATGWSEHDEKLIERIRCASSHLRRLISDLTDASLIESRRLSVDRKPVDLDDFVRSVVESLADVTSGHDVRVKSEGIRQAWIDPDRIRQVLGNLISNAAKYGQPGTAILVEELGRDDVVEIVITNRGPGIPAHQLPLLFNRFERARGERVAGLGLGLYITKGLVEAHGGRIWVESVPNDTTSFHISLPRHPPSTGLDDGR